MPGTSENTLDEVIRFIWKNQRDEVEGERKNYFNNIADSLDIHKDTVRRAVNWLESWGLAKTWKEGNKRCVRITWNPENSPKETH